MDKKWFAIIILMLLIPITLISFAIINNQVSAKSSPNTTLEECNTLKNNGEGSTNLVFIGSKELSEKYMDFFLSTSPFKENKGEFNFYYIDSYEPKCDLYKGIAILCYSKELIKKASSCPNDYTIVLENEQSRIRSSSYMNVMSINTQHPMSVLTHEFGHAYINLAEEYVPAKIPAGSENCVNECDKFNSETNGCFTECSESSYVRSIESGVMRTLSSNSYGIYNENLILKKLNSQKSTLITGKAISNQENCNEQEYYLIEANYKNNEISLIDKSLEDGCIGDTGQGIFNYNLIKNNQEIIHGTSFNPELIFTDAVGIEYIDGETFNNEGNFLLKVPVIPSSKSLSILQDDNELISIDLTDVGVRACKI